MFNICCSRLEITFDADLHPTLITIRSTQPEPTPQRGTHTHPTHPRMTFLWQVDRGPPAIILLSHSPARGMGSCFCVVSSSLLLSLPPIGEGILKLSGLGFLLLSLPPIGEGILKLSGLGFLLLSLPPIGEGILKLSGFGFPIIFPVVVVVVVNYGVYLVHYSRYLDETW